MSSRRMRSRQFTDEQLIDLVFKLQSMLPEARTHSSDRATAAKVLQDTCSYIRSLQREVDDLSERLSGLLATTEISTSQAAMIRSFLMQY